MQLFTAKERDSEYVESATCKNDNKILMRFFQRPLRNQRQLSSPLFPEQFNWVPILEQPSAS